MAVIDNRLLQEIYAEDPWKLLVCCIMLNQTSRKQVDRIIADGFFVKWPDAATMAIATEFEVATVIAQAGLQNRRARTLVNLARRWADWETPGGLYRWPPGVEEVAMLKGVGDYALDSYRIFVLGDRSYCFSGDKELLAWGAREGVEWQTN